MTDSKIQSAFDRLVELGCSSVTIGLFKNRFSVWLYYKPGVCGEAPDLLSALESLIKQVEGKG